jgi:hypothetical protein
MCTSAAIWIFRCLNEWLRSIARLPGANVTFNKRGNKSEAEKTKVTCLFLAFGDRGREGWSIQIGRGGCLPCRRNGSPSVYLLCMMPPSKSISLCQSVCSVTFVYQELCHSSWSSLLSTAPTATCVPICGLSLAVGCGECCRPHLSQPSRVLLVLPYNRRGGYAYAVVVVFIPEDESQS